MRFHGLMLLRDEGDIIGDSFDHLLSFCDALYILDMGSTDATWDIVMDRAAKDKRVVPFSNKPVVYHDGMRSMLFHEYRDRFENGDWILSIDADERYHIPPPQFVEERLRPGESAVNLQWYFFRLTEDEVHAYESSAVDIAEDRKRPISERRRYYQIAQYSEPRMCRYRKSMRWIDANPFPFNAGYVARERIPIRHYPHRDPEQMARRVRLRAKMMELNAHAGGHWKLSDWRHDIVRANTSTNPTNDSPPNKPQKQQKKQGVARMTGLDSDTVHFWTPGSQLEEVHIHAHLPSSKKRAAQWIAHRALLPLLDARRPAYNPAYQPNPIPEDFNKTIN